MIKKPKDLKISSGNFQMEAWCIKINERKFVEISGTDYVEWTPHSLKRLNKWIAAATDWLKS